ncbi:hypothetical protein V8C26DRAFT_414327, partial [Trichoderma gracile]
MIVQVRDHGAARGCACICRQTWNGAHAGWKASYEVQYSVETVRSMDGIRTSVRPLETMTPLAPSADGVKERRRVQGVGTSPPAIHTLTLVQCKTAQSLHGEFSLYTLRAWSSIVYCSGEILRI